MDNREKDELDLENPLGIADEPIVKTDADHLQPASGSSRRRRRARALGEDGIERPATGIGDTNVDADGATSIDMGYGGDGTNVKPSR